MGKKIKNIVSILLCFSMIFGCVSFSLVAVGAQSTYEYSQMGSSLKMLGRAVMVDEKVHMAMSASGAQVNVVASGDVTLQYVWTGSPGYLGVFIDGEYNRYKNLRADKGEIRTLVIAKNLAEGSHTIKVVKCNEFHDANGNLLNLIDLNSISFKGELGKAPTDNNLKIEFYGDSLTAAMGNLGTNSTNLTADNYGLNQDIYSAYAYYTASHFGADFSVMASSGEGIIKGYGNDERNTWSALHSYADPYNSIPWNDSDFDADVVVINLGANDTFNKILNYCQYTDDDFSLAASKIIEHIFSYNPDCKIIWLFPLPRIAMDYLYSDCIDGIERVTQCYKNCYFYAMTPADYGITNVDDYLGGADISDLDYEKLSSFLKGASSHPDAEQQHFYSNALINVINKIYYAKEFVVDEQGTLTEYNGSGGDIVVPNNVKKIANRVFRNTNVSSITIPDSVRSFGDSVFPLEPNLTLYCSCTSPAISTYRNINGITTVFSHNNYSFDFPEKMNDGISTYLYAKCEDCMDNYIPVKYADGNLITNSSGTDTLLLSALMLDSEGASLRLFDPPTQALRFRFNVNIPANAVVKDFGAIFSNASELGGSNDSIVLKDTAYNFNADYKVDVDLLEKNSEAKTGSVSYVDGTLKNFTALSKSGNEKIADISSNENGEYNISFNLAITGIAKGNFSSSRIARSYVTYEMYSHLYTVYDDQAMARNVNYVGEMILLSSTESDATKDYVRNNILN